MDFQSDEQVELISFLRSSSFFLSFWMRSIRRNVNKRVQVNPTLKGSLIRLSKVSVALLICVFQTLFFFQVMPYGGFYIGLLSLVLDLSIYCWAASGAHKAITTPRGRLKAPSRQRADARTLLLDQHL